MTARQTYWNNLFTIRDIDGELFRRMSFQEADEWLFAYEDMRSEGYDKESAAQRAWDCYFNARRVMS